MKRVLTGLQPSGQLHLGNYAGAIRQVLDLQEDHEMYVFVASYHALTTVKDPEILRANIRQSVIDYLAFGVDPDRCHIYLQQDVPAVCELTWLLSCVCPKSQLDKSTTYKDKVAKGIPASAGLFNYPLLMAADILAVDPDLVPVGKDQKQHVEITRDLAQKFNHAYGPERNSPVFKIPDLMLTEAGAVLPGIDGQKMSKSYGNLLDPFMPEKPLRKRIMKIVTDSKPPEEAKDAESSVPYQIFAALAGPDDPRTLALKERYAATGEHGMGYGEAKQALFELVMDTFAEARSRREALMQDQAEIDRVLKQGADAANALLSKTIERARTAVGL
ncbi:MAG: tryptophan--tRNA ligase [Planctomycetota bacterium]